MGDIQIYNKYAGLVPKPRRGKEVEIFVEKAVNTVHIKAKERSGALGYKGHCMLFISPTLSLFVFTGETNSFCPPDSSNYNADSQTSRGMASTKINLQKTSQRPATLRST